MSKFKKSILIIGILIIVIAAALGTTLALFATGSIVTDPIELTFRVRDKEQYYNGNALTINATLRSSSNPTGDVDFAEGYSYDDLLPGHRVVLTPSYSNGENGVTSVTDAKNPVTADVSVKILDADDFNVTKKYNIKVEPGTLTVKPQQLKLKLNIDENGKEYDGTQLVFNSDDFIITGGKIITGHRVVSTNNVGIVNVGDTIPADFKPHIFDASGNDVTSNYDIILENSSDTIKINPRWIYFKPKDIIKTYDGQSAVCELEFLEGTSLADGQFAEFEIVDEDNTSNFVDARTQQKIRVKDIKIYQMIDGVKRDVTSNYTLTDMEGIIQIDKANVTLIAESWTWTYNGQSHYLYNNKTLPEENVKGLLGGDIVREVNYSHDCSITNVGVIDNIIESYVISNIDNYNVTLVAGKLEVTPVKMTITTKSYEAYYNGEPVVNYTTVGSSLVVDYSVSYEDRNYTLASSHYIDVDVERSARSVNEIVDRLQNALVYDIKDIATGISVKSNYEITENFGYFTIRKVTIYVSLNNTVQNLTYNGKEQTPELSIRDISTDVPNSYNYKLTVDRTCFKLVNNTGEKIINAGKYQCSVDFIDDVRNLSQNYNLKVIDGAYIEAVIAAVSVDVTLLNYDDSESGAASFEFNNRVFQLDTVASVVAVVPNGSGVSFGIDDVDWSKVKLSIFTRKGTDASSYVYTETELKNGGTYYYNVEITDAEYKKNVKMVCANSNGYATIKVKPRSLDVEIRNVTHVYDGTNYIFDAYSVITYIGDNPSNLTKDDFYISYITLMDDHPETLIDMEASQIVTAETKGYVVALKGVNADNYKLVIDNPEVSMRGGNTSPNRAKFDYAVYFVLKYTLNVTTGSQEFTYDGGKHVNRQFTYSELPSTAFAVAYLDDESNTEVKDYTGEAGVDNVFGIKVYKKNNPEANLAQQYFNIIYTYGKLKVNKKSVKLTLPEISEQFNSNSLPFYTSDLMEEYASEFNEKLGMPLGHRFYVKKLYGEDGSEIFDKNLYLDSVGEKRGFAEFGVAEDGNDVSDNYDIDLVEAVLKITPCQVVLTLKDLPLTYKNAVLNSEIEPQNLYNGTLSEGLNSTDLVVVFDRDVKEVGKYTYTLAISDSVKAKNFVIVADPGTITVEKHQIFVYINDFIDGFDENGEEITMALEYDGNIKTISVFDAIASIDHNKKEGGVTDMTVAFRAVDFEVIPLGVFRDAIDDYYRYEINFKDRNYLNSYEIVIMKEVEVDDENLSDYDRTVGLLQIKPLEVFIFDVDTTDGELRKFFTFKEYEIMPTVERVIYTNVPKELLPLSVFTIERPDAPVERWGIDAGTYEYKLCVNAASHKNFSFKEFDQNGKMSRHFEVYAIDVNVVLKDYDNVTYQFDALYYDPIDQEVLKSAILSGLDFIDKVELVAMEGGVMGEVIGDNFYVSIAGVYYYNIVSTDINRNYIAENAKIIVRGANVDPEFAVPEYTYRGESISVEAQDVIDIDATNDKYGTEVHGYNFKFVQQGSDGIVHDGVLNINSAGVFVVQIVYEDDAGVIGSYNFSSTVAISVYRSKVSVTLVTPDEGREFSTIYYDGNVHEIPRELIGEFGVVQEDGSVLQGDLNVLDFITVVEGGRTVRDAGEYLFTVQFRFSEFYDSFELEIVNPEDAIFTIIPIDVTVTLDYYSVTYSGREIIPEVSSLIVDIKINEELLETLGGLDISNMLTVDDFKFHSEIKTIVAATYEYDVVIADKAYAVNFNLSFVGLGEEKEDEEEREEIEGYGIFVIKPYRIYLVLSPITTNTSRGELTDMQGSVSISSTSPIRGEDFFRITFAVVALESGNIAYLAEVEIDWTGCEDRMNCYEIIGAESMTYVANGEVEKEFPATAESSQNAAVTRFVYISQG